MTVSVSIGGTPVDPEAILLNGGLQGLTTAADGSVASGTAVIDDPFGAYDFVEWSQFVAEESDCALSRSFTGYVYGITTARGPYKSGAGRIHTMTIADLNALLHMQPLAAGASNRPRESGSARLAWLMTQPGMAGIVFDNGLITPNAAMFAADDLRDQFPDEVLQSICVAGLGSRIFYLTWDESAAAGEEVTLFYSEPESVLMSSSLAVSNLLSSIDGSVTFEPYLDSELERQGEEIYCGVRTLWGPAENRLFTHSATTHAAYFASSDPPGLHRIAILNLPRVGELSTAQHHSDVFLNVHSGALKTLTYTLRLPSDKVNLVNAGMLLSSELTHLMGFETGATPRINERTLSLTPDTNKFYDLVLKLSLNGAPIVGGGGGVPTPYQPVCNVGNIVIVQSAAVTNPTVLPASPTPGNMLLFVTAGRTTGTQLPTLGTWTLGRSESANRNVAGDYPIKIYYKPVESGDPASWVVPGVAGSKSYLIEVSGIDTYDTDAGASSMYGVNATTSITPTAGKVALLMSAAVLATDSAAYSPPWSTPATGMTELVDTGPGGPQLGINYQIVTSTSGSYTVGSTGNINGTGDTAAVAAVAFYCSGSDEPPGTGQEIPSEFVAYGDGVTTTFYTHFPYAPGSLKVWVDGHPILLGLTETNPATGAFTLDFAPLGPQGDSPAERVTATYQAGAGGTTVDFPGTGANTEAAFLAMVADMSIDAIEIAGGTYTWDDVEIDIDRSARPLAIRPRAGETVTFVGNGSTSSGTFFFGLNSTTKWITMSGFTFDGIALAQAGVFELRSGDYISLLDMTFKNLTRDHAVVGSAEYKSWCLYMSMGSGVRNLDHIVIDGWDCQSPVVNRDMSCMVVGSSTLQNGSISITNLTLDGYHHGLYVDVDTTNLTLDTWAMNDTGRSSVPSSIQFTAKDINGTYRNIVATASDPLLDNSTGTMVDGGGNSGI